MLYEAEAKSYRAVPLVAEEPMFHKVKQERHNKRCRMLFRMKN